MQNVAILRGKCQFLETEDFKKCKKCVEDCLLHFRENTTKIFECEGNCN